MLVLILEKKNVYWYSKFYVKIAHIFAAIAMTINPRYTYRDENGMEQTVSFAERSKIPSGSNIKTAFNNLCQARINAIKPRQNTENGIVLKVKNCNMNKKIDNMIDDVQVPSASIETKSLFDEPGIPELEALYYDEYNFNDGQYVGISDEGKAVYMNDLEKFYEAFTGGECFPNKCGIIIENMPNLEDIAIGQFFSSKIGEVIFVEKRPNGVYIKYKNPKDRDTLLKKKNFKFQGISLVMKKWEINKFSNSSKDFHNRNYVKMLIVLGKNVILVNPVTNYSNNTQNILKV